MRTYLAAGIVFLLITAPATANQSPEERAARNLEVLKKAYPKSSLERGEEGAVKFAFTVNRSGGIDGCAITSSSGYSALDKATCDVMLGGSTAKPKRAEDGRRIVATETGAIQWTLPKTVVRPATPPAMDTKAGQPGEAFFCNRHRRTGSIIVEDKICLVAADLVRAGEYAKQQTLIMQTPTGPLIP